MRKLMFVFVLVVCLCSGVHAQQSILPDHFGDWDATGPAKTITTKDLGTDWARGTNVEEVLQECGLGKIEERAYTSGPDQATLRLFQLRDSTTAYEFYTFLLEPGMKNMGVGTNSALSQYDGRILIGNFVLQATLSPHTKPESLDGLVAALKPNADSTPYPPLKEYLPTDWRIFGSEKYADGPGAFRSAMNSLGQGAYAGLSKEVGFGDEDKAEAILARYQGQHGSGVLLLLDYPTPQVAENRLHHLERALSAAAKKSGVTVERKASLLSLVFSATSEMHAQAIRDAVNYDTQVTWNEPHQTLTDPPLVRVLYKIFLFTSLFLVMATVTGIAFGGFRILIKHWWPGKVFDRPESIEVLQLGLSGKKIDPSDMY